MNSKFKTIYWTFGLLFSAFVFMSNNGNPPPFRTQAPPASGSTCASSGCHSNAGNFAGDVTFTGLPTQIMPNMPYTISVTVNNTDGNASKAGFQLAAIDESTANAGAFSNPSTGAGVETNNNVNFFEHRGGQNFNAANQANWTVTWTAPATIAGSNVQFWAVGNIANGNGSSSGDNIVFNTQSFNFAAAAPLSASISASSNATCNGGTNGSATVNPMGGASPYTYAWSNGSTMATANNLAAGSYTVTVTGSNQNTTTAQVTITQPTAISTMVSVTHETAVGANNGTATINISGGTAPYAGATNGQIVRQNLAPGIYNMMITDANGCTSTFSFTINSFVCPVITTTTTTTNASCPDAATGSATVTASNGATPYTYAWSNGGTTATVTGLTAGNYTVTVTDASNCQKVAMATVTASDMVNPSVTCPANITATCDAMVEYTVMSSDNCGTPTISVIAGLASGSTFPAGTTMQTIQATDLSGNTATCSFEVTVLDNALVHNFMVTQPSCADVNDGMATINVTGGIAPYTYAWSSGSTTATETGLTAGTYMVTATDSGGCETVATTTITANDLVNPTITCPDNMTTTCDAIAEYTVMSEDNCGATTIEIIAGLASGSTFPMGTTMQTIQATDLSGNTATCSFEVTVPDSDLNADFTVNEPSCAGLSDGMITINTTGGTPPYTVEWINEDPTQVSAGTYNVIVTDANGCSLNASVEVSEPLPIQMGTPTVMNATDGQNNGEVNVDISGGTGTYTYEWMMNGEVVSTEANLVDVSAGNYVLMVTDENDCTFTSDEIIVDNLVSIRELESVERLNILPNPTTGQFVLSLALYETQNVQVSIFDVTGKEVVRIAPERLLDKDFQLDLTSMAKGVYWLKIVVQGENVVRKVVVQ